MISIELIIKFIAILFVSIKGEEKFCGRDRRLLLGGVFNYDRILFAYSWKEINSVQLWLVWIYEAKNNELVPIGKDTTVDQVFPGL